MRQMQTIMIPGNPRGKGRPRFTRRGYAYTDAETTAYEGRVKRIWKSENCFTFPKAPTKVVINAFFAVPVSWSKKRREEAFGKPFLGKPDADNIAKILLDALNGGIAFHDDSQVDEIVVTKNYVLCDEDSPKVIVTIYGGEDE